MITCRGVPFQKTTVKTSLISSPGFSVYYHSRPSRIPHFCPTTSTNGHQRQCPPFRTVPNMADNIRVLDELSTLVQSTHYLEKLLKEQRGHVSRAWRRSILQLDTQHRRAYHEGLSRLQKIQQYLCETIDSAETSPMCKKSSKEVPRVPYDNEQNSGTLDLGFGLRLLLDYSALSGREEPQHIEGLLDG